MGKQVKYIQDYLTHLDILKHHGISDLIHKTDSFTQNIVSTPTLKYAYTPLCLGPQNALLTFIQCSDPACGEILNDDERLLFRKIIAALGYKESEVNLLSYDELEFTTETLLNHLTEKVKTVVFLNETLHLQTIKWSGEKQQAWVQFKKDNIKFSFSKIPSFTDMNKDSNLKKIAWQTLQVFKR